jgi:hypothetical protein
MKLEGRRTERFVSLYESHVCADQLHKFLACCRHRPYTKRIGLRLEHSNAPVRAYIIHQALRGVTLVYSCLDTFCRFKHRVHLISTCIQPSNFHQIGAESLAPSPALHYPRHKEIHLWTALAASSLNTSLISLKYKIPGRGRMQWLTFALTNTWGRHETITQQTGAIQYLLHESNSPPVETLVVSNDGPLL